MYPVSALEVPCACVQTTNYRTYEKSLGAATPLMELTIRALSAVAEPIIGVTMSTKSNVFHQLVRAFRNTIYITSFDRFE